MNFAFKFDSLVLSNRISQFKLDGHVQEADPFVRDQVHVCAP